MLDFTTRTGKPSITRNNLSAAIEAGLSGSARAMLVSREENGRFHVIPVLYGESVLNINRDLLSHLNEFPYPDAWLRDLRETISQRIVRRQKALADGRLSTPRDNTWEP